MIGEKLSVTASEPASTSPPLWGRWPRQGSEGGARREALCVAKQILRPGGLQAVTAAARPPSPALPHKGREGALGFVMNVAAYEAERAIP